MTLEKRISYVRTLTKVQIGLTVALGAFVLMISGTMGFAMLQDSGASVAWLPIMGLFAFFIVVVFGVGVALPWIVLNALKKRNEQWATAAMVSLILQVVCGGGLLSVFPLITIILLLNKEASAYIGMK